LFGAPKPAAGGLFGAAPAAGAMNPFGAVAPAANPFGGMPAANPMGMAAAPLAPAAAGSVTVVQQQPQVVLPPLPSTAARAKLPLDRS
jgi:hypothetical protein